MVSVIEEVQEVAESVMVNFTTFNPPVVNNFVGSLSVEVVLSGKFHK